MICYRAFCSVFFTHTEGRLVLYEQPPFFYRERKKLFQYYEDFFPQHGNKTINCFWKCYRTWTKLLTEFPPVWKDFCYFFWSFVQKGLTWKSVPHTYEAPDWLFSYHAAYKKHCLIPFPVETAGKGYIKPEQHWNYFY